ncbi:hypothetical protein MKX03_031006 [Papaver bracteatum]|nr:hypothetical protein MKX03_031006 [Papaver bracteatum]
MPSSVSMAQQECGDLQLLMKLEDGMHTQPPRTWICPSMQVSTAGNLSMSLISSELPSTYKALRYQQRRRSRGPANLFSNMVMDIIRNKRISLRRRIYVIYNFFLIWKMITHIVTFTFFCVIIPMCVMFPEVAIPKWGTVYVPTAITLLNTIETPRSIHLLAFWISLETVISITLTKATLIGFLDKKRASEWVSQRNSETLYTNLKTPTTVYQSNYHGTSFARKVETRSQIQVPLIFI